jgi:cell wall-associated NlpC family hydrolase
MPWPPTGAWDPVIDISDQVASPLTPGVTAEQPPLLPSASYDPQTAMINFNAIVEANQQFDALPAPDEIRFQPISTDKKRQAVIEWAKSKLGITYVWGGTTDRGYDCSGLVMKAFKQIGINMPRISYAQAFKGTRTKISDLQPGDLVAWIHGTLGPTRPDHIAIYLGNGMIIEAPHTPKYPGDPGGKVRIRKLDKNEPGMMGVHLNY